MKTEIKTFIQKMPKAELHVHLEGSTQPETLLKLAKKYKVSLPADDIKGLREWFKFRGFDHFLEVYFAIANCLRDAEDIELITCEFLKNQAKQNIKYTELTFTPHNQFITNGLGFDQQMDAVESAKKWAKKEYNIDMGIIMDINRMISPDEGLLVVDWALSRFGVQVIALGLGGPEVNNPPQKFEKAFQKANEAGMPCVLHAGETVGPQSVWGAIKVANTKRVGHGVRCAEDEKLMDYLAKKQIPLEVCMTSNVCIGVYPSIQKHSIKKLMEKGLYITINSDDPPLFNTTLTNEFILGCENFGWNKSLLKRFSLNAAKASLLKKDKKDILQKTFEDEFETLMQSLVETQSFAF